MPNLLETYRGKEFYNITFRNILKNNNIKHHSRNTSSGVLFAKKFNLTIRNLFKRPVFEKGDGKWTDVLSTITKHYNNRVHTSPKLTPIQASLKTNEVFAYNNLLDKRKKIKPKFQVNVLVRTVDLKNFLKIGFNQLIL